MFTRWKRCLLTFLAAAPLAGAGRDRDVVFYDTFRAKLDAGWTWLREDPKAWRTGENGLEVHIQPGNMWGPANDAKNVLIRPAPELNGGSLEITAAVVNKPTAQYEQVDLVWYYDDGHMVKLGQEMVDGQLSVVMGREEADKTRTISTTPLDSERVELQLSVDGKRIRGRFKTPKADWRDVGECDLPAKGPPKVSLQFYQGPADAEHWGRVTELSIRRTP